MSQAILPLPPGLTWNVKKTPNWGTIIQTATSGREVRVTNRVAPIWDWELTWEYLPDFASPAFVDFAAPSAPTLSAFASSGSGFPAFTYYAVITYLYPEGETLSSPEVSFTVPVNEFLQVAAPSNPGGGAVGWNCYVGAWSGGEVLQLRSAVNSSGNAVFVPGPIPFGTPWQESSIGLSAHNNDPAHYFDEVGTAQAITPPPVTTPLTFADANLVYSSWQQLIGFYNARQGSFDSFLFADATDSYLANPIGTGDGTTTQFQITKTYNGFTEAIKDILGPIALTVAGNPVTSGFTVGPTGIINFTTAPASGAVITVATSYFRRVRFTEDSLEGNNWQYNLFEMKSMKLTSVKI